MFIALFQCFSSRVSVSRAIKPFSESGRPPDWFSQKVKNLYKPSNIFSFFFVQLYIELDSQRQGQDNSFCLFLSTVPHNTQSCWKPQKLPSQY